MIIIAKRATEKESDCMYTHTWYIHVYHIQMGTLTCSKLLSSMLVYFIINGHSATDIACL